MLSQTQQYYTLLGPKKLQDESLYLVGQMEIKLWEVGSNLALTFTFIPVAIRIQGLLLQLAADNRWKETLGEKISELEG